MANHATVKTKKKMTPEGISAIIERLNKTLFKNLLNVEYSLDGKEPNWYITVKGDEYVIDNGILKGEISHRYGERQCWLNSQKSFEMRHNVLGGDFMWWIDAAILNEVALEYNGIHNDDGVGKMPVSKGRYDSFPAYIDRLYGRYKTFPNFIWEWVPPEFIPDNAVRE